MTDLAWLAGVKITLVLAGTLAAARACGAGSAALRHWILSAGVAAALLVPAVSGLWPTSMAAPIDARPWLGMDATVAPTRNLAHDDGDVSARVAIVVPAGAATSARGGQPWIGRAAIGIWLAGMALAAARLAWGLYQLRRLAAAATPIGEETWRQACDELCRRFGIQRPVRLLHGRHPTLLVTWGWRRPTVLVPARAREWPAHRVHIVLAHELAHVARRDWLAQLTAEVLRAVHWYHPFAWHARQRLRAESERAADDAVLAGGVDGATYAAHLVELARSLGTATPPWTPAPAMARPSSLEGRVRAMLDTSIDRTPLSRRAQLLVAGLVVAAIVPLAAVGAQYHTLGGSVVDPSGRVLPDVVVTLTNTTSSAKYEVRTDAAGRYQFVGLPPATYALAARALGFRTLAESVAIAANSERSLRLAVGTLEETVSVDGDSGPAEMPDAAAVARREEGRRRAAARQARAEAVCTAGPPTAVGGNILPPMKIGDTRPVYPEHLRTAGVGGTVTLRATIAQDGNVRIVSDIAGPHPDLNAAAEQAIREWEFTPTLLNCEAIEVEMRVTVNFSAAR